MLYSADTDIIKLDGRTTYLRHKAQDAQKIIKLREKMSLNGWVGRPVIMVDCGDFDVALTGTHRLAAVAHTSINPEIIWLPDNLTSEHFDLLDDASSDDDLLSALTTIAESNSNMQDIIDVMTQETNA